MKQQRLVSIKLSADVISAVERAAHAGDISPAEVIRSVLDAAFLRAGRSGEVADLASVRAALKQAEGWLELQAMLRAVGYVLRPDIDGLMLCTWPIEAQILQLKSLGTDLAALSLRFRAPFPGLLPGALGKAVIADKPVLEQEENTGVPDATPVFRTLRKQRAEAA
jgi:hypothetical protein